MLMANTTIRQYGRHRKGKVPITVWEDREFKEFLEKTAKASGLPNWSLSDHIRYVLRESCGLWNEPYRPAQGAQGRKKPTA